MFHHCLKNKENLLIEHSKSGNVALDLVNFMHVWVVAPVVTHESSLDLSDGTHFWPKYKSFDGMVIPKQSLFVESHGQSSLFPDASFKF